MKDGLFFLLTFLLCSRLHAAVVDTALTYSASMHKNIKAIVITPDGYKTSKPLPVLYLLHGYGGNQTDWIKKVPSITKYADQYNMLIVCPDGNIGSWYFDSPVDTNYRYETYVAKELVTWIDEHYKTIANKAGRAITGLSMGGHGALYLSIKHQDVFGAGGSMSGGVDIRPFPLNWEIARRLGNYADYPQRWEENTVINLTHLLTQKTLPLMIDCGSDDFFYDANKRLHQKLLETNIPHDFISRRGGHTWEYWTNAIAYQCLFFANFFGSRV